ncbi:hypothetical protein JKP88DRAFT_270011 [Tribonema minus]|uniref:Mannose-P-dolichol utilization defect 1 protein homolog n=1 Tax=Tribonema minus TaxID=303371 RepID=A0A835YUU5_9STRA|nr:hypothetical protein JKP88DRAFT_270011 [Tribonema minus]
MTVMDEQALVWGLFTKDCYMTMVEQGDVGNVECLKAVGAKALGYAMIAASFAIKAPQIAKIVGSKSVVGLSPSAFYSETVAYIINAMYHIARGSPLSAYGEVLTILVQNLVLVVLLWAYMTPQERPALAGRAFVIMGFATIAVGCAALPPEYLHLLPLTNLPLILVARIPQILTIYQNGHTGQLAFITMAMNVAGTALRMLTTIQEVGWDKGLLIQYGTSLVFNGILFVQILYYWGATNKFVDSEDKKKVA